MSVGKEGFQAACLPPGWKAEMRASVLPGGLVIPELGPESASALLARLEESAEYLRSLTNDELVGHLGRAGARLLDRDDALRQEAETWLPDEAGLSPPMARLVLDRMAADWTSDALRRLLRSEFPEPEMLEGFRPGSEGDGLRVMGDSLAFHVGAGSVPGTGATSILRSLLVRTPVILKPGRGDVVLPVLLARAIAEEDERLAGGVAVLYWPGGSGPALEEAALQRADRVVVYGGFEAVEEVRGRIPVTTPLVAYHHRVSVGVVGRGRLGSGGESREIAAKAARAVAAYEQRGCVSPQVIWVEEGGDVNPEAWAELLAKEMARGVDELPPGPTDPGLAGRIHQLRGEAELREAAGHGHRGVRLRRPRVDGTLRTGPGAGGRVYGTPGPGEAAEGSASATGSPPEATTRPPVRGSGGGGGQEGGAGRRAGPNRRESGHRLFPAGLAPSVVDARRPGTSPSPGTLDHSRSRLGVTMPPGCSARVRAFR